MECSGCHRVIHEVAGDPYRLTITTVALDNSESSEVRWLCGECGQRFDDKIRNPPQEPKMR